MKLYKLNEGVLIESNNEFYLSNSRDFDVLINRDNLNKYIQSSLEDFQPVNKDKAAALITSSVLPPIGSQEVWAAGVTYLRSRDARMEESKDSGGATFYDKVYEADRPELFFKSLPHRVVGNGGTVNIRRDSTWNVPEPELTLFINSNGNIQAYSIGNDMSSRSIEGENPLYLPQAKTYEKSAAIGPCLYIPAEPISPNTTISMIIKRNDTVVFEGKISLNMMKRSLTELTAFLYRETSFPNGSFLMTGTCLVPENDFTLQPDDIIDISIENIGTLTNRVAYRTIEH